ncbi:M3 family metallopeptidase [Hyphomonas johnsonii]|uniref:Peptidase family M3 n=1 Tax=Hyphomonas johnsonii MHS-2 TaxID=1280950 RepID=A0A059FHI3_9PROT|nr:M3 family metallopeptidase [Hyphomonas johnsonii]KCZ90100.1 peptidase family M3 [Hyphomonas johnsonii MHS-2]
MKSFPFALPLAGLALMAAACAPADGKAETPVPAPVNTLETEAKAMMADVVLAPVSADAFSIRCDNSLDLMNKMIAEMEGRDSVADAADIKFLDTITNLGYSVGFGEASVVAEANPDATLRAAGDLCLQRTSDVLTRLSLSRPIYDRLAAMDATTLTAREAFLLARTLRDYRRSGIDKDEETRDKVRTLNAELAEISSEFSRNLREIQGSIQLDSVTALDGLPQDYIDAHQPDENGKITITTDYPDTGPVFNYAKNDSLRRDLSLATGNRAWPENVAPLRRLLEKRYELATLLGYPNWAAYITEDKMTGSPQVAEAFLSRVEAAATDAAGIEHERLLAKLNETQPDATTVPEWSSSYLSEQIRQSDYALDSQEVRQYFAYDNVRAGIFSLVEDLFGVQITPWEDAPVWDASVTAHEMHRNGELIGRFFLDMHPRDGKYKHAAAFPVRFGPTSDGVPVGVLICNFPAGDHTTGLMEHRQVETFLHEFGHLIHQMFSGQPDFANLSMSNLEWDFIEAPSQMLENWVWDYDTLAKFAVNADGETIPRDLVEKMNAARDFGTGLGTLRQLTYAYISLDYYNRPPDEVDFDDIWNERESALSPFEILPDTHRYASLGHLDGYSAIVYTYQWSLAISTDLFTEFEKNGLRDLETAARYRDMVLAPGSSKPAAQLVHDFLGRDWTPEAYEKKLIDAAKSEAPMKKKKK